MDQDQYDRWWEKVKRRNERKKLQLKPISGPYSASKIRERDRKEKKYVG